MKHSYTLLIVFTFLLVTIFSCQKELHFPVPKPTSTFTIVVDGVVHNLEIRKKITQLKDTAHVEINAASPDYEINLVSKASTHVNGVGDYFLWCCRNDVYEQTSGSRVHWETDRIGDNKQKGFVKITKWNDAGFEGTYSLTAKVGRALNAPRKEFTGSFVIYY